MCARCWHCARVRHSKHELVSDVHDSNGNQRHYKRLSSSGGVWFTFESQDYAPMKLYACYPEPAYFLHDSAHSDLTLEKGRVVLLEDDWRIWVRIDSNSVQRILLRRSEEHVLIYLAVKATKR